MNCAACCVFRNFHGFIQQISSLTLDSSTDELSEALIIAENRQITDDLRISCLPGFTKPLIHVVIYCTYCFCLVLHVVLHMGGPT